MSGITRDVFLYSVPDVFIRDFFARTTLINNYTDGKFELSVELSNLSKLRNIPMRQVEASLFDQQGKEVLKLSEMADFGKAAIQKLISYLPFLVLNPGPLKHLTSILWLLN